MTRIEPLRRMILQLRQIFFTEARTFIALSSSVNEAFRFDHNSSGSISSSAIHTDETSDGPEPVT